VALPDRVPTVASTVRHLPALSETRLLTVPIAIVLLAACGAGGGQTGVDGSSVGPSPIVLQDTSPGQLSVYVAVSLGGYDISNRDKTRINVMFQNNGHPVKFVAGEKVICGGVTPLTRFIGAFEGTVPTASIAGRTMKCTYTSGQQSAALTFRVPKALVILSPREHEQLPHGPHTIVTYSGEPDSTIWVVALGTQAKAVATSDATSATSATVDTSALKGGAGSIAVTQPSLQLTELQGELFQSVGGSAWSATMVAVVWT